METPDAAKAMRRFALIVIVVSLAELVLVFAHWVSWAGGSYSISGLETWAGLGDVVRVPSDSISVASIFVSGYAVAALAAVACLSAILLVRRMAPALVALVVVTGIATTSVAGYLATADDWLLLPPGDVGGGAYGFPTWALYSEIGLGVVHALIGGVLAALYIGVRSSEPTHTPTAETRTSALGG